MEIKQQLTWVWQKWGFSTSLNICSFYELLYKIRTLILSKPHLRQAQKRYIQWLRSTRLPHINYFYLPTFKIYITAHMQAKRKNNFRSTTKINFH